MVIETIYNSMQTGFLLIGILMMNFALGQDLKNHQWENRVVLILSQNEHAKEYRQQIVQFNSLYKELRERRLLTYHVLPQRYSLINNYVNPDQNEWISSSALFDKFAEKNVDFKVVLIGLDGKIKLQKSGPLTAEELFRTIDSMPMRRAELNKKQNR